MEEEEDPPEEPLCHAVFQSQRNLQLVHDGAMLKVEELSAQLKKERLRSSELETRLQSSSISRMKMEEVRTTELLLDSVSRGSFM